MLLMLFLTLMMMMMMMIDGVCDVVVVVQCIMRAKGHSPDRLEVHSSFAVFRLFLWMWLVCDCDFGAAAS